MKKPVFEDSFWEDLAEYNPLGILLTGQDVRDWFDAKWLVFSTYGYRNQRRAIINWWSRVRIEEIEEARQRAQTRANALENLEIEKAIKAESQAENVVVIDHFSKLRHG